MIPFSSCFVSRYWNGVTERSDQAADKAGFEHLHDKPYEDRGIVRVAGRFTVESLAPHRTLGVDENDELIDHLAESRTGYDGQQDFVAHDPRAPEHIRRSSRPTARTSSPSPRSPRGPVI